MSKTKSRTLGVFIFIITLCLFGSPTMKAQCAFIKNTLNCPVIVDIDIKYSNPTCVLCIPAIGISVSANQTDPISCGACNPICDIVVTVHDIGGPIAPVSADFSITCPAGAILPGNCGSTMICYDVLTNTFIIQ